MISYEPLWETMRKKNISTYMLISRFSFSKGTLDSLKHNRSITMNTLNYIVNMLGCTPEEVIKYTPDSSSTSADEVSRT